MRCLEMRLILIAFILAGVVSAPQLFAQENTQAEVLFQAAKHKEQVDGDLEAAIQLYQEIVAEHSTDHVVAAKALVQLGRCYEKLGSEEASKAYRRVVSDYADQREQVAIARSRLAALTRVESPREPIGITTRQIWAGPGVDILGGPSADGRYLSYVDWTTGDLAIRDLVSGETRHLTNKGSWYESSEFAESSRISPDGKHVVYAWFNRDQFYELRIISTDGGEPRVLYRSEDTYWIAPAAWSSDGQHVLALFVKQDGTNQIALVSVVERSARVVKNLGWREAGGLSLSPDGRHVAYASQSADDAEEADLYLAAVDGSLNTTLVEHPANDVYPVWTPDGNAVLYLSDRTGTVSAWLVPVSGGKPAGPSRLIKQNMGRSAPMGFDASGALHYGLVAAMHDIYVAALDFETGKVVEAPVRLSQRFVGSNSQPDWSPDGQHLAYVSDRRFAPAGPSLPTIVIRSLDTGKERDLTPKMHAFGSVRVRWSPDGQSFVMAGREKTGQQGIYQIDATTGDKTALVLGKSLRSYLHSPEWSPDGKAIVYLHSDGTTKRSTIVWRDLASGTERELYRGTVATSEAWRFAISPDSRYIAFTLWDAPSRAFTLNVLPLGDGPVRELARVQQPDFLPGDGFAWMPDGKQLVFAKGKLLADGLDQAQELWRISPEGGEPQKLDLATPGLQSLRIHPDGRRVAASAGQWRFELWVIENFLPRSGK